MRLRGDLAKRVIIEHPRHLATHRAVEPPAAFLRLRVRRRGRLRRSRRAQRLARGVRASPRRHQRSQRLRLRSHRRRRRDRDF